MPVKVVSAHNQMTGMLDYRRIYLHMQSESYRASDQGF